MKPAVPVALPADGSGIKFPTGMDDNGTEGAIKHKFELAQTEVTYELWKKVYDWANKGSNTCQASGQYCYTFANAGMEGSMGTAGAALTANKNHPVTKISWRDSIVWCNAYTEWYNATKGASLSVVYKKGTDILRDATAKTGSDFDVDKATYAGAIAWDGTGTAPVGYPGTPTATGFRLPTSAEWEFAARWQGTTGNGNAIQKGSYWFTRGNSASGATLPVGIGGIALPTGKTWAYLRDEAARSPAP